jgi:hypothetical protein
MFERFSLETPCGLLFAGNPISLPLKIAPESLTQKCPTMLKKLLNVIAYLTLVG